jgi:hypothetical protein
LWLLPSVNPVAEVVLAGSPRPAPDCLKGLLVSVVTDLDEISLLREQKQ